MDLGLLLPLSLSFSAREVWSVKIGRDGGLVAPPSGRFGYDRGKVVNKWAMDNWRRLEAQSDGFYEGQCIDGCGKANGVATERKGLEDDYCANSTTPLVHLHFFISSSNRHTVFF